LFSTGGMFGAALVALLLRAGVPPAQQLAGIAVALVLAVLWGSRGMLAVHPVAVGPAGLGEAAHFAWPRGLLLVLGLLVLAGMMAEGVMYDWCVLYLQQELGLPADRAAWGYAAFSGAMALARFGGDALRERFAERRLLAAGAGMAALAMAAVLLAATPALAFVGFVLVGAGLAPVAPVLFNAATRVPGVSRAAAIAAVTSIGYSGFLIGPPLVGSLAQAFSLTAALSVVVVAALVLALGARRLPGKT
jgi:fucose permease